MFNPSSRYLIENKHARGKFLSVASDNHHVARGLLVRALNNHDCCWHTNTSLNVSFAFYIGVVSGESLWSMMFW